MMLNRLRRITRDGRWIPEIDGMRFIAISSVFLFHMGGELYARSGRIIAMEPRFWWLDRVLSNGDRGVGVFFVISGMILALPFARQMLLGTRAVSLRRYYMRRVTRLEPPYVLATLLATFMIVVYSHGMPAGYMGHVIATLFYQHNLVYGELSPVNPVSWSLEVEIQFYVLAPVVMLMFRIPGTALRRGLMLVSIVAIGISQQPFVQVPRFGGSILFYLQYFIAGLLVADVFVLDLERLKSSPVWDALALGALFAIFWPPHDAFWPHVVLPLAVSVLCVAVMRSVVVRRVFANPLIAVLGGMCYSIYLLHFLFIAALFKVTRRAIVAGASFPVNLGIQVLVTGVPVLLLCGLFYLVIERPCMDPDWPPKLWHRLTGRSEAEVEALDSRGVSE